ncbi:MAG: hypothetical protein KKI08_20260 [Armatimonadetes bacterium]|nr:hypothetical protein [Armatimonadota bacterium]
MADLEQDAIGQVRVETLHLPGAPGEYGIRLDRFGVMVSARVGGEVRYAWVVIGSQQRLYDTVMSDKEVPGRTEAAYHQIVTWLQGQGFETRHGSYSFPVDLRLMVAAAGCTRQHEGIETHSEKGSEA